ncbi:MAG TPA: hypothetical protein VJL59_00380, partial [Anaerolineales bacterium]|nr:hypothetical protein [Anaerolineales bacterium]
EGDDQQKRNEALHGFVILGLLTTHKGTQSWLPAAILFLGLGAGFFTVGGVSLMMDMTFTDVHR